MIVAVLMTIWVMIFLVEDSIIEIVGNISSLRYCYCVSCACLD